MLRAMVDIRVWPSRDWLGILVAYIADVMLKTEKSKVVGRAAS
jgi:hypothetical protein